MDPVATTAHWVAAARARESLRPDALFRDPFAASLSGPVGERWMEETEGGPQREQVSAYVSLRTRFFDDELMRAARAGVRQVVILAAGLDARAYRLDWPAGTQLFEVDRLEVLAYKDKVLAASQARPRCTRKTLGADLTLPFADSLRAAGFVTSERSAWLIEGLLPYLREIDVRRLMTQVSSLSAPGSALAFDCAGVDPNTAPAFAPQAQQMRARGIQMHFHCADPVALLAPYGWAARREPIEVLAERLGRPLPWKDLDAADPLHAHFVAGSRRSAEG
jgi:methyltransferase (TIGR00027 family)